MELILEVKLVVPNLNTNSVLLQSNKVCRCIYRSFEKDTNGNVVHGACNLAIIFVATVQKYYVIRHNVPSPWRGSLLLSNCNVVG